VTFVGRLSRGAIRVVGAKAFPESDAGDAAKKRRHDKPAVSRKASHARGILAYAAERALA
jgi:hypothetical protein